MYFLDELALVLILLEGSAFAMSCIDYLNVRKVKAVITTHYSEVKAHGYNTEDIETASMEFNTDTVTIYNLLSGIPEKVMP